MEKRFLIGMTRWPLYKELNSKLHYRTFLKEGVHTNACLYSSTFFFLVGD